jgi:hypothetical protein
MLVLNTVFSNCIFCFLKRSSSLNNFNRFLTFKFDESRQIHFFEFFCETFYKSDSILFRIFTYDQQLIQTQHYDFFQNDFEN